MKAILILADGTTFEGESIGAAGTAIGEVVFNTAMTGYQEMLTDPANAGQLLTFTYPLIGNYGVNDEDNESDAIHPEGLIVRELCNQPSNWRSTLSLQEYLMLGGTVGIQGIDTRALTRHLRKNGTMMGAISAELTRSELTAVLGSAPKYDEINFTQRISTDQTFVYQSKEAECKRHIALIDLGVRRSSLNLLASQGCKITILPYNASAEEVLNLKPDGVVFSSGPGNAALLSEPVAAARDLAGKVPLFGFGVGHQVLGIALGAEIVKLKYGHRGANHPVKNTTTGKIAITSQNHGSVIDAANMPDELEVTHVSLNDSTIEGLRHKSLPIRSIQYQPEESDFNLLWEF